MKNIITKEIQMHLQGMSVYKIAKQLGELPNTVLVNLRNHGVLRKSLGRDIEEKVAKWFEKQGLKVERQRGDAPFDLLISKEKIDVKSAHLSISNKKRKNIHFVYSFQLQSKKNRLFDKDFSKIDWFLLVFLDHEGKPMYRIRSSDIKPKYTLTIYNLKTTKLPLQFIGYLEEKGA